MKFTEWYPPHIKPVRKGVYNASVIKYAGRYRKWDGRTWYAYAGTPKLAAEVTEKFERGGVFWRGLTTKDGK